MYWTRRRRRPLVRPSSPRCRPGSAELNRWNSWARKKRKKQGLPKKDEERGAWLHRWYASDEGDEVRTFEENGQKIVEWRPKKSRQTVDFAHCIAFTLAAISPTRSLHYTVALDSGSEARDLCRQGLMPLQTIEALRGLARPSFKAAGVSCGGFYPYL